ncbi:hypothetical protein [Hyalangium gracile]|uniref:hypothetical protein n=1 Tax=Hyalangium gracile TaxID=394092 RepID=UPI001CCBB500|nr:hypothetical protein [Hyalangium gracile]
MSTFNHEEETQWSKKSTGDKGWMVRGDVVEKVLPSARGGFYRTLGDIQRLVT